MRRLGAIAFVFLSALLVLCGCQAPMRADEGIENVAFSVEDTKQSVEDTKQPQAPEPAASEPQPGERAALRAASLAGIRYRFGGTSPVEGFDCSGLVHFSYREAAGVTLPRDTRSLRTSSQRIERAELRPGDLIFFRLRGPHGHVGIYAGEGRFVHAPSAGKRVRFELLDAPFWRRKYAESRRPLI